MGFNKISVLLFFLLLQFYINYIYYIQTLINLKRINISDSIIFTTIGRDYLINMKISYFNLINGTIRATLFTIFLTIVSYEIYYTLIDMYYFINKYSSDYVLTSTINEVFDQVSDYMILVFIYILNRKNSNEICRMLNFNKINIKTSLNIIFISTIVLWIAGIITKLIMNIIFFNITEGVNDLITQDIKDSLFNAIGTAFLSPLYEEIIFRGIVLNILKKYMNKYYAILVQAILFGVVHLDIEQFIDAGIYGIFLGILVFYTKSIYSSILAHIIANSIPVILNCSTNQFILIICLMQIIGLVILIKNRKHIIRKIKLSLE